MNINEIKNFMTHIVFFEINNNVIGNFICKINDDIFDFTNCVIKFEKNNIIIDPKPSFIEGTKKLEKISYVDLCKKISKYMYYIETLNNMDYKISGNKILFDDVSINVDTDDVRFSEDMKFRDFIKLFRRDKYGSLYQKTKCKSIV